MLLIDSWLTTFRWERRHPVCRRRHSIYIPLVGGKVEADRMSALPALAIKL